MLVVGRGAREPGRAGSAAGARQEQKLRRAEELNAQHGRAHRDSQRRRLLPPGRRAGPADLRQQYHGMRDLLARYRSLREDHLRYLVKCGVIRPALRTNADTFFAFPGSRRHQAGATTSSTRARRSGASSGRCWPQRQGQLAFDFRLDAAPAKILDARSGARRAAGRAAGRRRVVARDTRAGRRVLPRRVRARRRRRVDARARRPRPIARRSSSIPYLVAALINLANIHYSRDELVEAQALYERAIGLESRFLRGALQPRQHLPRPRTLHRGAGAATAKRCASTRTTPTRTSIWR